MVMSQRTTFAQISQVICCTRIASLMDMEIIVALPTLEELRQYVHRALCEHDRLDPQQTPLFQGVVKRKGKPCGLFFHASGPRQMRNYALWTGEEHRIIFYTSSGERFAQASLSDEPDLKEFSVVS